MKRTFILSVAILCMGLLYSKAQSTDISTLPYAVYVSDADCKAGEKITLSLKMKNEEAAPGFQCDVYLPEGMTFAEDEDGFILAELSTTRTTAQKTDFFSAAYQGDGALHILCNSTKGYTFKDNDGEVATIVVKVSDKVASGTYPIYVRNAIVSDTSAKDHKVGKDLQSSITVKGGSATPVEKVTLDRHEASITEGATLQLTATVSPEDATDKRVTWTSTDSLVASVNADGVVTAKKVGEAIIYAAATDGSEAHDSCKVKVNPILVSKIELDKTSVEAFVGDEIQLTATVSPEETGNKDVAWSSSNEDIAIVSQNGLVNILAEGNVTITAKTKDGSELSAECKIRCLINGVDTLSSENERFDVYTTNGILFRKNVSTLKDLPKNMYIIKGKVVKVEVRQGIYAWGCALALLRERTL